METTRRGFLSPYFQIFFGAVLVTGAELFLKVGAKATASSAAWAWTGVGALVSPWVWAGMVLMVLSFLSWLYVLKHLPLALAYPISNVVHIFVPLSCWIFLGESIGLLRWCGIFLVLIGLVVVAKPFSKIEERI
jgi:drug/metabolite transporter (DMT)-like permease